MPSLVVVRLKDGTLRTEEEGIGEPAIPLIPSTFSGVVVRLTKGAAPVTVPLLPPLVFRLMPVGLGVLCIRLGGIVGSCNQWLDLNR